MRYNIGGREYESDVPIYILMQLRDAGIFTREQKPMEYLRGVMARLKELHRIEVEEVDQPFLQADLLLEAIEKHGLARRVD